VGSRLIDPTDPKVTIVGDKRVRKQVDKLEGAADQLVAAADDLRIRAAAKAERLSAAATDKAADLLDVDLERNQKGGKKGRLALLLAGLGGAAFFMKKKREQELDEALWQEPDSN